MKKVSIKSMTVISVLFIMILLQACGSGGGGGDSTQAGPTQPDNQLDSEQATVSGAVVDVNGVPVSGAVVTISSAPVTVISDAEGKFSAVVEPGAHAIVIRIGSEEIYSGTFTGSADTPYSLGQIHASFAVVFELKIGGAQADAGNEVLQNTEGDYLVVGSTISTPAGKNDVYLVKVSASGNVIWEKTFEGTSSDSGNSIQQTADGGYIIAGEYGIDEYNSNIYLIKTDSEGALIWEKKYFGGTSYDLGESVQQTADGGYIIAGSTGSFASNQDDQDVYLVKTDLNGDMQWSRNYGGDQQDSGASVLQTSDRGFIIAGSTSSGVESSDVYLIKTDENGNPQWEKTYGGSGHDYGESVQQTSDGGFIITGRTSLDFNNSDVYLIKTDAEGNKIWEKHFGGVNVDLGYSVQETADGGYIIAGEYAGDAGYLIKTGPDGNKIWEKTFGGSSNNIGLSVCQTKDGGYIITGRANSGQDDDVLIIKTDMYGNTG